uniref:uncharacterized protein LOC120338817 isoform X2 n=1 Tax=Styela clava TaxID=7725 RepID=UPI001939BBA1|nr:uncharacterized protein LOC120338817 isoform X2 [Styela clava]
MSPSTIKRVQSIILGFSLIMKGRCTHTYAYIFYGKYPDGEFDHNVFGAYKPCSDQMDYCHILPIRGNITYSPLRSAAKSIYYPDEWPNTIALQYSGYPWILLDVNKKQIEVGDMTYTFEDYSPMWYIDSYYHFSNVKMSHIDAQRYCEGLDGYLVVPKHGPLNQWINGKVSGSMWSGIKYINETWMYHVGQGKGIWFNEAEFIKSNVLAPGGDGSCMLISMGSMKWSSESCSKKLSVVCRIHEHLRYGHTMMVVYEKYRNHTEASKVCTDAYEFLVRPDSAKKLKWLSSIIKFYQHSGLFLIDALYNMETEVYESTQGDVILEEMWAPGQPNTSLHCVVMNVNGKLLSFDCDDGYNAQFICEYKHIKDNFVAVVDNKRYYWHNDTTFQSVASTKCESDEGGSLAEASQLWQIMTLVSTYATDYATNKTFWLMLAGGYNIQNGMVVANDNRPNDMCPTFRTLHIPTFEWKNCNTIHHYLCRKEYKEVIPDEDQSLCPPGFMRAEESTCLRAYHETVEWHVAKTVCEADTEQRGSLVKFQHNHPQSIPVLYFMKSQANTADEQFWVGMCGSESRGTYLFWTSKNATSDDITTPYYAIKGECLAVSPLNADINKYNTLWRLYNFGFVCQQEAIMISEYNTLNLTEESHLYEMKAFFGDVEFCPESYMSFGDHCLKFPNPTKVTFEEAQNWCYDSSHPSSIAVDDSEIKHSVMSKLAHALNFTVAETYWISLRPSYSENFIHTDLFEPSPINHWENDDWKDNGYVVLKIPDKWEKLSSKQSRWYFCQSKQCFRNHPSSYSGTMNITRNGFQCQAWASQSPHWHNVSVEQNPEIWKENYCRDDGQYAGPWCYTTSHFMRHELCDITGCNSNLVRYPSNIITKEKYSDFIPAIEYSNVTLECRDDEVLLDCECTNEHCLGVKVIEKTALEDRFSGFLDSQCLLVAKPMKLLFMTRSKIRCLSINNYFLTRSIITKPGSAVNISCPPRMKLASCNSFDSGLSEYPNKVTLGQALRTPIANTIDVCTSRDCTGEDCETTAICLMTSISQIVTVHVSNRLRYTDRSIIFPAIKEPRWKNTNAAFYVFPYDDIGTLCFWIKTASKYVGTILYLTRTHTYPVLAVAGGSQTESGLFIAPNGEKIKFDPTVLMDNYWHKMCLTFGSTNDSSSTCALYIDSILTAETNEWVTCNKGMLYPYGHLSLGRGMDVFNPVILSDPDILITDNSFLSENERIVLQSPFEGVIGDIACYENPLSTEALRRLRFACFETDWYMGIPTLALSQEYKYLKGSDIYAGTRIYGEIKTYTGSKPCSEDIDFYKLFTYENSVETSSTNVTITVDVHASNYELLKNMMVDKYYVSIKCNRESSSQESPLISAISEFPLIQMEKNATKIININNLLSVEDYTCYIYSHVNLWTKSNQENHLKIRFTTTTGPVTNVTSLVYLNKMINSYEILEPGTDKLWWQPPDRGEITQYKVIAYTKLTNNTFIQIKNEIIKSDDFHNYTVMKEEGSAGAIPGSWYNVYISPITANSEGDVKIFSDRLQPAAPIFSSGRSVGQGDTVNLVLKWEDLYQEYVDGYVMHYKAIADLKWTVVNIPPLRTSHQLLGLKSLTEYSIRLQSLAGLKTSSPSEMNITTGTAGNYRFEMSRISSSSVALDWDVDILCYKYQVEMKAISALDNVPISKSNCYFTTSIFLQIVNVIRCTDSIRRFDKTLTQTVDKLKKGCIYEALIQHINENGDIEYTLTTNFSNPADLTTVNNFRLVAATENALQFSWENPSRLEEVDLFQITVSLAKTPWIQEKWAVFSEPRATITDLKEATRYVINVTSARKKEIANESASLIVWTKRRNVSSLFTWSDWTSYSQCPKTCGENVTQTRQRYCQNPDLDTDDFCPVDDIEMRDKETETRFCKLESCAIDGQWSEWSYYGPCDKSCGEGGFQTRNRTCSNPAPAHDGKYCNGGSLWKTEIRQCGHQPCPINGNWTAWVKIFSCDVTCGTGKQKRMRLCRNPVPQYGGMDCVGDESDTIPCNTDPCPVPGEWQSWSSWSICLNFCGLSNSSRTRECKISSTGHNCAGSEDMKETENKLCIASDPCEDDFHWGPWGHFTACSKTCGTTTMRERVRTCVWNDDVYQKARPCNDQKIQKLMCGARECPIDGSWGEWSTWGPCSVSCEKGVQLRMRLCNNPKPAFGGKDCEGSKTGSQMEKKECVRQGCPSGRYLNSPTTLRHCKPETGKSSVVWPWTFAGVTQNASCPAGTSGTAFRLCSQNQIWQEEDLTACTSEKVKKIVDKIEEANVGTSTGFSAISTEILQILEGDTKGKHLSVAGDILQLHGMLNKLLDWKPSTFSDLSRAAKLEYVDTITTSVEKITNLKYQNIWMSLNGSTALDLLKNFLTLIENTSLYGQDVIESDTSVIYKNNLNQDFNLFLKTVGQITKQGCLHFHWKIHPNMKWKRAQSV